MALTFNPSTKVISLSSGTTSLDVRDLYSRWKDWMQTSDNMKYLPAFETTGGDTVDAAAGTSVPLYAFLVNGWRVKPQEADHTLNVTGGVLLVSGGGDPFVDTAGSFVVRINYSQPVQAITVSTGGGSAPTAAEVANAVWANATGAAVATRLAEAWGRLGLDASKPLITGTTQISFGDIVMAMTEAGSNVTVTRQ